MLSASVCLTCMQTMTFDQIYTYLERKRNARHLLRAAPRAGGWFPLCLAALNASLMLLWFWGNNKKKLFFSGQTLPLNSFLKLEDTADSQLSMTIAQQKVKINHSGSTIKRAGGALCVRAFCC